MTIGKGSGMMTSALQLQHVDPKRRMVMVNYFEGGLINVAYSFDATVKVNICTDLYINFSDIAGLLYS